jgi:hypothetical protein
MTTLADLLDNLLPLLQPRQSELHVNATVLEVSDQTHLVELASNPKIRRYLLARLSERLALVDPGAEDALTKALLAEGQTPRLAKGADT